MSVSLTKSQQDIVSLLLSLPNSYGVDISETLSVNRNGVRHSVLKVMGGTSSEAKRCSKCGSTPIVAYKHVTFIWKEGTFMRCEFRSDRMSKTLRSIASATKAVRN